MLPKALGENMELRRTEQINQLWALITKEKWRSTHLRKITLGALVAVMEWRKIKGTKQPWDMTTRERRRNTSPRKIMPKALVASMESRRTEWISAVGFSEMEAPTTAYKKTTPTEAASSGARGLKAKFESMAEEKRKCEEEEKAQHMARQQQERKAVVKMHLEAQQPAAPVEEQVVPAPLPKKISSEAWPPAQSYAPPEPKPVRASREPVPSLPTRQGPLEDNEEPPALPPRAPEDFQVEQEPVYEAAPEPEPKPEPEPENDYEDVEGIDRCDDEAEGDYEDVLEPEDSSFPTTQAGSSGSQAGALGISAVALYDYQGEGSDELSFDPDDIITDIEMVDEGWWRGCCRGHFGLFPANYVKLLQ